MTRRIAVLAATGLCALLTACATAQRPDPLEPWNRGVYAFNDAVDVAVIKPVATVWRDVLPQPLRHGVSNFFGNFGDLWSATNLALQGRFGESLSDLGRFGTNTVFGVLGFFDVASELGLEKHGEDFGQTLGVWGVPQGAYVVWPLLGPSTLRDSFDIPGSMAFSPASLVTPTSASLGVTSARFFNLRAELLQATNLLDTIALDKYSFTRDAYLQRRRSLVYNGSPPEEAGDDASSDNGANPYLDEMDEAAGAPAPSVPPASSARPPVPAASRP
ncbi:MlaA family lipoprotein [Leptothrix discophora]|uniref:MlaA family lipoprotein n=1 Tax=Leptothrix discophora TaxID=89 RepID=A0ABT9G641_LEPDI|nr:MlaA family lipoprotein [Leptothrix discophora]MDP4301947.1 MlaA family lipoprotein [Leptothrix discophora]